MTRAAALLLCLLCLTGCASLDAAWQSIRDLTTDSPATPVAPPAVDPPAVNPVGPAPDAGVVPPSMTEITWDEPTSPAAWPETAELGAVTITSDGLRTESLTGTDGWPVRQDGGEKPSIGNWVLVRKCADSKWHGAAVEWLGRGKTRVTGKHWTPGADAIHGCIGAEGAPASGTEVYVLVTGCIRGGQGCGQERSNLQRAVWP